ncbi:MAG TPA: methyltransferase domain-containing protein [Steroidobacter sp.]|uniref:methyltransferase domain-containing protein n=1 Tax=Steroidobacter sp. TaxID=1978227 RepID=UPI002ED953A7
MADPSKLAFAECAPYYRFRAPYAPEAFASIQTTFGLNHSSRVLDLGCGPGTVTIPLARVVGSVVAVDPCVEMIEEGRKLADSGNIQWRCMRAEDATEEVGDFDVVTMGQSFHWMERDRVLSQVAKLIKPGGGLVLINPGRRRPQESWESLVYGVIARYVAPNERHPSKSPELAHEPSLLRSASFSEFTTTEFGMAFDRDLDSIVGYVYSSSTSPRSAFGNRALEFERELSETLRRINPPGVFRERVETELIVAKKRV